MHNVNVEAVEQAAAQAQADPSSVRQAVELNGEWQVAEGAPQFWATIPYPSGEVELSCDFPPPLGGSGAAPNPLAFHSGSFHGLTAGHHMAPLGSGVASDRTGDHDGGEADYHHRHDWDRQCSLGHRGTIHGTMALFGAQRSG